MNTRRTLWVLFASTAVFAGATPARAAGPVTRVAADGAGLRYDPARRVYEMRAADGVAMLALWVPPNVTPIRGIFINGNPGGIGGDNRQFTTDRTFRAFAARMGFGLMGLHSMPGNTIRERLGARIFEAMKEFAAFGVHPELANLPFISLGNSNGAGTSYNLVMIAPERAVCFAMNVGGMSQVPPDAALEVPGFIVIGPKDHGLPPRPGQPQLNEEQRVARVRGQVADARKRGARWAWLAEQNKGHQVGRIFDYQMEYFEHCVAARLPALNEPGGDPRRGPVKLKSIPLEKGWLADDLKWQSGLTPIAAYTDTSFKGDRSIASWLMDEDLASLYRGLSTYDNPISLSFANLGVIKNENDSGRFLTEVGGHVVVPGTKVDLAVDLSHFPTWQHVDVYQGAHLVKGVDADAKAADAEKRNHVVVTLHPDLSAGAFAYTVLARDEKGTLRTATPLHLVVEDPKHPGTAPDPVVPEAKVVAGAAPTTPPIDPAIKTAATLQAAALTSAEEKRMRFGDERISDVWNALGDRAAVLTLAPPGDRVDEKTFEGGPADATVRVRAAYGAAGIYWQFEAEDDVEAEPVTTEQLTGRDAIALLLSPRSASALWHTPRADAFVNAGWSIALDSAEIQSPFGGKQRPTHVRFGWSDPWEWHATGISRRDLEHRRGIKIDVARTGKTRSQEWFVPWRAVGLTGLAARPEAGAHLAFALGFNDMDPVGAELGKAERLRIHGKSPWYAGSMEGPNDVWAELILMPAPPTTAMKN